MFKTEMHCHSGNVSSCAHATAEEIIEKYVAAGYTTLVSTEHINPWTFPREIEGGSWRGKLDYFMNGYHKLLEAADGRINVILGAEIRFMRENNSDYLVYGLTEDFLRDLGDPRYMNIHTLSRELHDAGMMIFQAHPFRPSMMVTDPRLLDGIEIANLSPWHESYNDIAETWAKRNALIGISGTDFHDSNHTPLGGILTANEIRDSATLISVLKDGSFTPIINNKKTQA